MGRMTLDMLDGCAIPKRGDLLYSNVGTKRTRTWLVLAVHRLRSTKGVPRCRLWMERWWEVDVALRLQLYSSAERAGGQRAIDFVRYKQKKRKRTFEQLMRGSQ